MYETYVVLTAILTAAFLTVIFLLWKVRRYLRDNRIKLMQSAVIKTEGRIVRKFFGGADPRISDSRYITLRITVNEKTVEIDKSVDRELFFAYEEGDLIDLFVTDEEEMKVYPLADIIDKSQEKKSIPQDNTENTAACKA